VIVSGCWGESWVRIPIVKGSVGESFVCISTRDEGGILVAATRAGRDDRPTQSEVEERGLARAQSLVREVNEQIHHLRFMGSDRDVRTILCECSSSDCVVQIEITPDEYERARCFPTRFVLVPGHEVLATERVVERQRGYVVVEKIGVGGAVALRLDPRRGKA
jgi:hypothetical protein